MAVNHKILRKPVRLPEVSESDPGVGLASTLCLDPWQHSLHLLHILFSFVLDTWQVDLDHFFSLSTTCHRTPLGRSATQFKMIGYRRTRLIVQWTTTCPSSGRELRRSIDTIVATRFPQPPSYHHHKHERNPWNSVKLMENDFYFILRIRPLWLISALCRSFNQLKSTVDYRALFQSVNFYIFYFFRNKVE